MRIPYKPSSAPSISERISLKIDFSPVRLGEKPNPKNHNKQFFRNLKKATEPVLFFYLFCLNNKNHAGLAVPPD